MAHLHDNGQLTPASLALELLPSAIWSRGLGSLLSLPTLPPLSGLWWWSSDFNSGGGGGGSVLGR